MHGRGSGGGGTTVTGGAATLIGTGSPEGAVASAEGSTYYNRTDGSFWVKTGGVATNTGWSQILGA